MVSFPFLPHTVSIGTSAMKLAEYLEWCHTVQNRYKDVTKWRSPWPGQPHKNYTGDPVFRRLRAQRVRSGALDGKSSPVDSYPEDLSDRSTDLEDDATLDYPTPDSTPPPPAQPNQHTRLSSHHTLGNPYDSSPSADHVSRSKDPTGARWKPIRWPYHLPVTRSCRPTNFVSLSNGSGKIIKRTGTLRGQLSTRKLVKELVCLRSGWKLGWHDCLHSSQIQHSTFEKPCTRSSDALRHARPVVRQWEWERWEKIRLSQTAPIEHRLAWTAHPHSTQQYSATRKYQAPSTNHHAFASLRGFIPSDARWAVALMFLTILFIVPEEKLRCEVVFRLMRSSQRQTMLALASFGEAMNGGIKKIVWKPDSCGPWKFLASDHTPDSNICFVLPHQFN